MAGPCEGKLQRVQQLRRDLGFCLADTEHPEQCAWIEENLRIAEFAYLDCIMNTVMAARWGHSKLMMDRLMQLARISEEIFPEYIDIRPWPWPCGMRSLEVRKEIFDHPEKAMAFSRKIAEAVQETGIELKEDETYACLICIRKKPEYVSEAIKECQLGFDTESGSRIDFVMEPQIMSQVLAELQSDRIKYEEQEKKTS